MEPTYFTFACEMKLNLTMELEVELQDGVDYEKNLDLNEIV
jgi:hypothetical protein